MKKLTLSALVTLLLVGLTVLVVTVTTRAATVQVSDVFQMVDHVQVAEIVRDEVIQVEI